MGASAVVHSPGGVHTLDENSKAAGRRREQLVELVDRLRRLDLGVRREKEYHNGKRRALGLRLVPGKAWGLVEFEIVQIEPMRHHHDFALGQLPCRHPSSRRAGAEKSSTQVLVRPDRNARSSASRRTSQSC